MKFINENPILRIVLIALFFVCGLVLVITGWKLTGEMRGLIRMLIGVCVLIAALWIYNSPYSSK